MPKAHPTHPAHRAKSEVHPSKDEVTQILELISLTGSRYTRYRDLLIVQLLADCGLRINELITLKVHQATRHNVICSAIELRGDQCKRGYSRTVPTSARVQAAVSDYIHDATYRLIDADQWLFRSRYNIECHITPRCVQLMLAYYATRAIGRHIHPHQLRHHAATELLKVTNTRVVQKFLGHQRLTTTEIYTHPDYADMKTAFDKLGR